MCGYIWHEQLGSGPVRQLGGGASQLLPVPTAPNHGPAHTHGELMCFGSLGVLLHATASAGPEAPLRPVLQLKVAGQAELIQEIQSDMVGGNLR